MRIIGIAFSGWADPGQAAQDSSSIKSHLPGLKYISIGGGNNNGRWTATSLQSLTKSIQSDALFGYDGIAYDIEEGDPGLSSAFQQSFQAAKTKGFKVIVTISNSAPYGISDGASLMRDFFVNSDIDYLSPQLYETGEEQANVYDTGMGVDWNEYGQAKAAVVPSIVESSLYPSAQSYFASRGVQLKGYIQWKQV